MSYAPHQQYVAPALNSTGLRLLLIGVVLIESLNSVFLWLLDIILNCLPSIGAPEVWYGASRTGLLIQLFSFGLLGLSVIIVTKMLNHRGLLSLTGPLPKACRQLGVVLFSILVVFALTELIPPYWDKGEILEIRDLSEWGVTLPFAILALFVQTGSEELFYRGYIQQQIAAQTPHTFAWLLVPNIMFGLAHLETGDFSIPALQYVIWAFCFGLAASDLTARTGNLGAAIGFHLANNVYAFLYFAEYSAPDSGLALILFAQDSIEARFEAEPQFLSGAFLMELFGIALMWATARIAIRR